MRRAGQVLIGAFALAVVAPAAWLLRSSGEPGATLRIATAALVNDRSRSPDAAARVDLAFLRKCTDPNEVRRVVAGLTRAAAEGDTQAQVLLGKALRENLAGIPKDPAAARAWFQRAADAGDASAAYYLGVMIRAGEGSAADPREAARWLDVAQARGSAQAAFLLGNAYRAGAGVPKDDARALALYEAAAQRELPAALQTLAMAHLHGELGFSPDEDEYRRYEMEAEHAVGRPFEP